MHDYTYYRENHTVIGMKLTKGTYKDVLKLIANHGATEKYTANFEECYIDFTQQWPREGVQSLKKGMYITSENAGLKVYSSYDFKNRFSRIYKMSSWYSPTDAEVKVLECLNRDAEMCYPYSYICSETGLTRKEAKAAVSNLRSMGAVEYWRGLMTEENEVAGSGFCWGDPHRAEALLYRHYGGSDDNQA